MKNTTFQITARDNSCAARTGLIQTSHGNIETPAFIPVATLGDVKTLTPDNLRDAGSQVVLGNTYHLMQLPGLDVLEACGGLARFMAWDAPTVTDSGGFQVFSLSNTRTLSEEGVSFRSIYDGALLNLTPESACLIQRTIGADFIYALDECPPYPSTHEDAARAVALTSRWAKRFLKTWQDSENQDNAFQAAVLIVQGGIYDDLRKQSVEELAELNPPAFAIGGLSVGEPQAEMVEITKKCCEWLPDEKSRHLMGVGTPSDLLMCIEAGVDLFDCVMPTRNGRNGQAFTSHGIVNIRNAKHKADQTALDSECNCATCRKFSRAYLHHLFATGELLGMHLLSLHNITYYHYLMRSAREAIGKSDFIHWKSNIETTWSERA
ncbi:tRNA guanosine(34) transglycosylase Tgt [bacterium]|nr:tRNA guanosine(34) transglycosylase Tgt [bacterium]